VRPVFGSGKDLDAVRRRLGVGSAWHAPPVTLVFLLAAILVIAVGALLAVGRLGELPEVEPDRAPLALPEDRPLAREDVDGVRFAVGMRGYRMDEVDDVLDRLAVEADQREARIAELERRLAGHGVPRPMPTDPEA
jgi:DivIVA domain-containing protein